MNRILLIIIVVTVISFFCGLYSIGFPSSEKASFEQILVLWSRYRLDDARKMACDILRVAPNTSNVNYILGFFEFYYYRHLKRALGYALKAVSLEPEVVRNYVLLGAIHSALGNEKEAMRTYNKGMKYDQNDGDLCFYAGMSAWKQKQTKNAVALFQKAIRKSPRLPQAYPMLHRVLVEMEDYEEAYFVWKKWFMISPLEPGIGKLPSWNTQYGALVTQSKTKLQVWHLELGKLYCHLGLYDEAKIAYQRASSEPSCRLESEKKLAEIQLYIDFRERLVAFFNEYYRHEAVNGPGGKAKIEPIFRETICKGLSFFPLNKSVRHMSLDEMIMAISERYGVLIQFVPNNEYLDCRFGILMGAFSQKMNLWGKQNTLQCTLVGNMICNGFDGWYKVNEGGIGGWCHDPGEFFMVYEKLAEMDWLVEMTLNQTPLSKGFKLETDSSPNSRLPGEVYYSFQLSSGFAQKFMEDFMRRMKIEEISEITQCDYLQDRLRKYILEATIIHESQHAIDWKSGHRFSLVEMEYRSKLTELAYGEIQYLNLFWYMTPVLGMPDNTHGAANEILFRDIIEYITYYSEKIPQINIKQNILQQMTKLSQESIRDIAKEIFHSKFGLKDISG